MILFAHLSAKGKEPNIPSNIAIFNYHDIENQGISPPPLKKGGRGDLKNPPMLKYNPKLRANARQLRQNLTDSERSLWRQLRGKQLAGVQFYRQKPIGDYIIDFYAPRARLVIEIDGSQHLEAPHADKDRERDEHLGRLGLMVLRVNSRQVLTETEAVMEFIYQTITQRLTE